MAFSKQRIKEVPSEVQVLIQSFPQVFAEPTGLPTLRGREHSIHLQPCLGPISVRPYRYPHAHKEEMEKLVKSMLDT